MTAAVRCEMPGIKRVALVAHDNKKLDLLDWAAFNRDLLGRHALHATGNTGRLLEDKLGLPVTTFRSGPSAGTSRLAPGSSIARSTS